MPAGAEPMTHDRDTGRSLRSLRPNRLHEALALHQRGDLQQARKIYEEILQRQPGHFDALHLLGVVAAQTKQSNEALRLLGLALGVNPNHSLAQYNHGLALKELGQLPAALTSFDRSIALKPDFAPAHFERGIVLTELGRAAEALASYRRATTARPDYAEAYYNRALVLRSLGQWAAALESYDQAIAARPDYARAWASRATVLLLCGDFVRGWRDFEWRWKDDSRLTERRDFAQPLWLGAESIAGKTILLHAEQGMGDTLQFCRYAKLVADLGARVILEAPALLAALLKRVDGVAQLIIRGTSLPAFDCHCPLMSLPLAFKTTLTTVPAQIPYLTAAEDRILQWKATLGKCQKLRVGLVWAGGFRPHLPELWSVNNRRNVPLVKLAPLRHPAIEFFSLQKGQPAESELASLTAGSWDGPRIVDLAGQLGDFADTAAVIHNLDLVISVDTATAHLAGALGKPVWIMNRFDTCWRWMLDRSDSPWYPTARLYRQRIAGDWDAVIASVRSDLFQLVGH